MDAVLIDEKTFQQMQEDHIWIMRQKAGDGKKRRRGLPDGDGGTSIRVAVVSGSSTVGSDHMVCTLDDEDGESVDVIFFISNGTSMDEAAPLLNVGDKILVAFVAGSWRGIAPWEGAEGCE